MLRLLDVSVDSCVEQLTAQIHKHSHWLQSWFVSCMIDCGCHNSCQRWKWWLTNDSVELAEGEITRLSAKPPDNHPTSPCLSHYLFTATLNHCQTDNTDKISSGGVCVEMCRWAWSYYTHQLCCYTDRVISDSLYRQNSLPGAYTEQSRHLNDYEHP